MTDIKFLESMGKIKKLSNPDFARAKSLVEASAKNMEFIIQMELSDTTSTIIFREAYESIRQMGDARWFILGYKPKDHEASMEILKNEKIKNSAKLQKLDRFKAIRHDANYSGYLIPKSVTEEILEFWGDCGFEILCILKDELENNLNSLI